MKNMLFEKRTSITILETQIMTKRQANEDTYDNTQTMIKKID